MTAPPLGAIADDAIGRSMSTYTVGPGNVERVIGLATDDVLAALRPHIEAAVRARYGQFVAAVTSAPEARCRRCGLALPPCMTCGKPSQCGELLCIEHEPDDGGWGCVIASQLPGKSDSDGRGSDRP